MASQFHQIANLLEKVSKIEYFSVFFQFVNRTALCIVLNNKLRTAMASFPLYPFLAFSLFFTFLLFNA